MKHTHRFFVSRTVAPGDHMRLDGDDSFHAARVLRLGPGAVVELADSEGNVYEGEVASVDDEMEIVAGRVIESGSGAGAPGIALTVVQALPQGRKLDVVVDSLAQLGVYRLVPVYSEKSVARGKRSGGKPVARGNRSGGKPERWRRIARSAAAQSKSSRIMAVDEPAGLLDWLKDFRGPVVVLSTEVDGEPLSVLARRLAEAGGQASEGELGMALVVGPEGGLSEGEVGALEGMSASFAALGRQVLRTELAGVIAAAIVLHELGRLG